MFVIFGLKTKARVLAMLNYVCSNCHQPAAHRIITFWRWFSLFFIPVFPISKKRYIDQCIACGVEYELTREQAEGIIGQPEEPQTTEAQIH